MSEIENNAAIEANPQALDLVRNLRIVRPPAVVMAEAHDVAKVLADSIASKKHPLVFNGKQYLEFADWQLTGQFFGITAKIESTSALELDGAVGYEAAAIALRADGAVLSRAEAMCMNDEKNWSRKPYFQLRAMAQTRAMRKVLANVLSWVPVLAGCEPGALEEEDDDATPANSNKLAGFRSKHDERDALIQSIKKVCRSLNENGTEPKWTGKELNRFAVEHFQVGVADLSVGQLREMENLLSARVDVLKATADDQERLGLIAAIRQEMPEAEITAELKHYEGRQLEDLTLTQLAEIRDSSLPF